MTRAWFEKRFRNLQRLADTSRTEYGYIAYAVRAELALWHADRVSS